MTKEQIEQKAKDLVNEIDYSGITNPKAYTAIMMADWLLHHQWVSVEDALPPKKERYSKYVIMRNRIGGHYIGCYDFEEKLWIDGNLEMIYMDITHWMTIPPLAEEGGEK